MAKPIDDYIREAARDADPNALATEDNHVSRGLVRHGDATAHALGFQLSFPVTVGVGNIGYTKPPLSGPVGLTAPDIASKSMGRGDKQFSTETASIARWMAAVAIKNDLPPELPVMAALVESGLRNLSYGDKDSIGYFQIRVSVHGQAAVATPEAQLNWFIQTAKGSPKSKKGRNNNWTAAFFKSEIEAARRIGSEALLAEWLGRWCADIERPRESLEYKYKERYADAKRLLYGS